MDTGLLQRMGIDEAEIRTRMGLNNNFGEDLRNRLGHGNLEDIRNSMELNAIREDLRNQMGLNNVDNNLRIGSNDNHHSDGEDFRRIRSNNNPRSDGEDFRNVIDNEIEQNESINRMMQEYNIIQGSQNNVNHNGSSSRVAKNYEEELRRKMGFSSSVSTELNDIRGENGQSSPFYKAQHSVVNSDDPQSAFHRKNNAEEEKSEPNSKHLDETIEAVARNQFDYDPDAPLLRAKQNKFLDQFQIKQEPIDYDLMAANLTAGLMNPDRRHMCPHCCKGFRSRQQLLQHSLVHSNLRKYHCNYCERSFKQLSHLHQHHRIHTGEKPYTCPLNGCDKSFPQLSNLQHHIRNHDKLAESQFQCHLCDRVYPNEATLKAHNTRMHVHSKLISDLKNSATFSSVPPVSQTSTVSNIQPRQRKRKASRPQHINNRNIIPFFPNQVEDRSGIYGNSYKEGEQEDYVYILDSDDDVSPDIPHKKMGVSSNNNLYSNHNSQNEQFQHSQIMDKSNSDGSNGRHSDIRHSDLDINQGVSDPRRSNLDLNHGVSDPRHGNLDINHGVADSRQRQDIGYYSNLYQNSVTSRLNLPKMSSELPKLKTNEPYPEIYQHNGNGILTSSEILQSSAANDNNQNFKHSVISDRLAFSRDESRELQKDVDQRSQLANEMQHYNGNMGLDLSTNSSEVARMYEERSRYQADGLYPSNHNDPIFQRIAENQSQIRNKVNAMYQDQRMVDNRGSNMQRASYNWPRKELMSRDLQLSDTDSESDTDSRQHFQTPHLGTDVYDDPMN